MRFNIQKKNKAPTLNLAGGEAFAETAKLELVSILLTATLQNQYYRAADVTAKRLKELIGQISDKTFVAKAAVHARTKAGMRSVTHLAACEIAHAVKGQKWTAGFYNQLVHRPDDALEILACYLAAYGKPLPNSLKKGLGLALARFDGYQLAKYRKSSAEISLVDAVNLVHPKHTEALKQLVDGTLPPAETWETKLTQAGMAAETEGEVAELKKEAWEKLIRGRKIGYFALLRNLRNILAQAPELTDDVAALLKDESLIKKSLVLPFRYLTALEALQQAGLPDAGRIMSALGDAVDLSLSNVPKFNGRTLVVLDGSASMMGRPIKIGALFASVLFKSNEADLMLFSDSAEYVSLNGRDSTLTLAQWLESKCQSGGTNFHAIFETAKRPYDRIIILSDMQGWIGGTAPVSTFQAYKKRTGADPKVFSFDLQGYGTLQFPERHIYCLAGFSDKTMDCLRFLDSGASDLLKEIESIHL